LCGSRDESSFVPQAREEKESGMNRPIHFEIHAPDPDAVRPFYKDVLGWTFSKWDGPHEYWLIHTGEGEGINGGLMPSRDGQPRTVNTINVANVDDICEKVKANGGQVVVEKMPIQGIGYVAYCVDPGGALFGVMQNDTTAK